MSDDTVDVGTEFVGEGCAGDQVSWYFYSKEADTCQFWLQVVLDNFNFQSLLYHKTCPELTLQMLSGESNHKLLQIQLMALS